MSNSVYIIGNGFDLNLGLKTSYKNFIQSKQFISYLPKSLFQYLNEKQNILNWIDVELLLAGYTVDEYLWDSEEVLDFDDFHEQYIFLKNALCDYLNEQTLAEVGEEVSAHQLMFEAISANAKIFTFNFTSTTSKLKAISKNLNALDLNKIRYVHGSIEKKDIVFGVDDDAEIDTKCSFLYKSAALGYAGNELVSALNDCSRLVIFGHSLGETDHDYFKDFFMQCVNGGKMGITIELYYYDEAARSDLIRQIQKLTNNQLATLRNRNNFFQKKVS